MKKHISIKTLRKAASLLLTLVTLVALPVSAYAAVDVPAPTDYFYVGDFANVISTETEMEICSKAGQLYADTGAQIVIVTIDFLGGTQIDEYALALFNEWQIGDAEKENGLLLLMVIGEEDYWAMPGYGLEDYLSAGTIQNILDEHLEPAFALEDYDSGAMVAYTGFEIAIRDIYATDRVPDRDYSPGYGGTPEYSGNYVPGYSRAAFIGTFAFIIIMLTIFVIVLAAVSSTSRRRRYYVGYTPRPRPWYRSFWYHRPPHYGGMGHVHRPPPPPPPGMHGGGAGRPGGGWFGGGGSFGGSGPSGGSSRGGGAGRSFGGGSSGGGGGRSSGGGGGGRSSGGGGGSRGDGAGRK